MPLPLHWLPYFSSTTFRTEKSIKFIKTRKPKATLLLKQIKPNTFLIQISNPEEEQMFKNWLGPTNM